jgi:hypothetical protein
METLRTFGAAGNFGLGLSLRGPRPDAIIGCAGGGPSNAGESGANCGLHDGRIYVQCERCAVMAENGAAASACN